MLISAAHGGVISVGDATLTFAPGALPADAYVSITADGGVFDLNAYDAATGERITTFAVAPVLSVFVGRYRAVAPRILYLDPQLGPEAMPSSYDPRTGVVRSALPHFSEYTVLADGSLELALDAAAPHVVTISATATKLVIDLDGDVEEYDLDEYDRVIIRGGAADDSLIVEASAAAYLGILVFEGGEGEDTAELRLPDAGGAYDLATAEPVKPRFEITIGGDRQLVSAGLEELTITGGTGADELTFTAGAAEYGGRFSFAGGDGDDTLLGPDKITFWQIDAANGGRFSTGPFDDFFFTDVESVTGGNKLDGFAFSAGGHLDGTVGGGAGEVELDLGFVYLKGSLTITRQVADITLSDGTTVLDDAVFYKVGIESAEVFIGSGRGTDGAIGLSGTIGPDGGLALTIVSSGTETYVAVRAADLEVALTGVAGVTLTTGALAVDFNSTDANGLFLDFSTFDVDDDPGTADPFTVPGAGSVSEIDFDTAVRRGTAVGATVDLFGLVGGTVDVSFEQRSVDLLDLDGSAATTEDPARGRLDARLRARHHRAAPRLRRLPDLRHRRHDRPGEHLRARRVGRGRARRRHRRAASGRRSPRATWR